RFCGKKANFMTLVLWAVLTLHPDPVATISGLESSWERPTPASLLTRTRAFPRKIRFCGTTAKCGTSETWEGPLVSGNARTIEGKSSVCPASPNTRERVLLENPDATLSCGRMVR